SPPLPTLLPYTTLFRSPICNTGPKPQAATHSTPLQENSPSAVTSPSFTPSLSSKCCIIRSAPTKQQGPVRHISSTYLPFGCRKRSEEHTSELQSRENLV